MINLVKEFHLKRVKSQILFLFIYFLETVRRFNPVPDIQPVSVKLLRIIGLGPRKYLFVEVKGGIHTVLLTVLWLNLALGQYRRILHWNL